MSRFRKLQWRIVGRTCAVFLFLVAAGLAEAQTDGGSEAPAGQRPDFGVGFGVIMIKGIISALIAGFPSGLLMMWTTRLSTAVKLDYWETYKINASGLIIGNIAATFIAAGAVFAGMGKFGAMAITMSICIALMVWYYSDRIASKLEAPFVTGLKATALYCLIYIPLLVGYAMIVSK